MKKIALLFCLFILIVSCRQAPKVEPPVVNAVPAEWELPKLPANEEFVIRKTFKGAMRTCEFSAIILHYLEVKYKIPKDKVLMGVSTCVDDIIYTKNFHSNPNIKGLFHLGGLAGLPFTGVSGLGALSHHIPEGGTMLLLLEPHIGYSADKGWGYILRYDQHAPSTCCGALMGTLSKLKDNKLTGKVSDEDYQADKIGQFALEHKDQILKADIPIVEFTKMISRESEKQIREHVMQVDMEHMNYIVILTGVLINTDYNYSDYQVIKHIVIYDVKKKTFTEEILIP
ncbi:MAG: hypothetical protein PSX36_02835 [bacterium]|nr:hypothetical protein [bacterium]